MTSAAVPAMHEGQLDISDELARRMIGEQFSDLQGLPVRRLRTAGTVNTIMRVGDGLVARFPLASAALDGLQSEAAALGEFAKVCPFPASEPIGIGVATSGYPSAWAVQTWVPGEPATARGLEGSDGLATDLVTLIGALRAADVRGRTFDGRGRGGDLRDHDEWMTESFTRSAHLLDADRASRLWSRLRDLPRAGADVLSHRDLTPPNLLISEGRLVGILDAGSFGAADPALDLVGAWHVLDETRRAQVRIGVGAGEVEWLRGAAWALQQAMGLCWYYENSNPAMSALGLSTVERLLDDAEVGALTR